MNKKRLMTICEFLTPQDKIIDVGCDHAYVPIEMAKRGCRMILATDIHEGALKIATQNIKKENMNRFIKLQQTDGLDGIELIQYDTLIISGMGCSTIKHILQKKNLDSIKKIILQANNDLPEVRLFMQNINYQLENEKIVYEKGHYYVVMKYCKGNSSLSKKELLFGLYQKGNQTYYKDLFQKYKMIRKKIPWTHFQERRKWYILIKLLKSYL